MSISDTFVRVVCSFMLNVEPHEIQSMGQSLVNVREGGKKDEEVQIRKGDEGETRGRRGWHTRTQSSTKIDPF